jgi:hypothetical protein
VETCFQKEISCSQGKALDARNCGGSKALVRNKKEEMMSMPYTKKNRILARVHLSRWSPVAAAVMKTEYPRAKVERDGDYMVFIKHSAPRKEKMQPMSVSFAVPSHSRWADVQGGERKKKKHR